MSRLTRLTGRVRRRHADPYTAEQDSALRQALVAAAESVSPADDGLDQIRNKIAAGQSAAHRLRWHFGVQAAGEPWWRSLLPPRGWLPAMTAAVIERFRPDPNRAGWFGWLRPAAAVGTGLFVVTAASLAVAALPAALSPSSSTGGGPVVTPSATKTHHPKTKTDSTGLTPSNSGSGSSGPPGQNGGKGGGPTQPESTPSCTPVGTPSATPTGTPTTPTITPTTPTITPTDSQSTSPADGSSSTSSPTAGSASSTSPAAGPQPSTGAAPTPGDVAMAPEAMAPVPAASPEATGKALLSPDGWGQSREDAVRATLVDGTTVSPPPSPADTPQPTASVTVGPPPTQTPVPTVPPPPCA